MMNEKQVEFLSLIKSLKTIVDDVESKCDCENLLDVPLYKVNDAIISIKYLLNVIDSKKDELANEQSIVSDNEVQRQFQRDLEIINEVHEKVIENED